MYRQIIFVTLLRLKPGLDELLLEDLARIVDASRQFSGCLSFELYRLHSEPNFMVLHEIWETQETYQAYFHSQIKAELARIVAPSLARPIETWQLDEIF